ncbi:Carbohydrate sulfotransferase 15 [Holothuria leucospilota]|uniref:Carbohydrate sulfotransferase 15 n=1 Tax=Holothuria leucospilota TaxID=206669 RepID=A0A9Q1HFX2_HOLLE|nr:Carbohydrate sulfotransferase 15 [Holothuria leucospilota]
MQKWKVLYFLVFVGALILTASLTTDKGMTSTLRSVLLSRDSLLKLRNISSSSTAAYIERIKSSPTAAYIKRIGSDIKDQISRYTSGEENKLIGNNGVVLSWNRYGDLTTLFGWRPKDLQESFLSDYKSPCFLIDAKLFCLPFFFLAGMPQSGTEDIWSKITQHHHVATSNRDPHWWTRHIRADVNLRAYSFQLTRDLRNHLRFAEKSSHLRTVKEMIVGDGSYSTFCDNLLWEKSKDVDRGPGTFQMIKSILPKAKFIISLREPANRLYSEYLDSSHLKPKTADAYHSIVTKAKQSLADCISEIGVRRCALSATINKTTGTEDLPRIQLSLYTVFIQEFLKHFPRDQLFVVRMEDWYSGCKDILPQLFKFLELDPLPKASINPICEKRRQTVINQSNVTAGLQLAATKHMVRNFLAPYNQQLADILEDPLFLWSDVA